MADIIPENNYNPSLAEDLKWVEIDKDTLPHIEGKFGNYPRYAELIYNISAGSSSSVSYNDLKSKPKINGIELYGNKTSSELKLLGQDSIQNTIDDNADDEHIPSSLAVKNYINQQVTDLYKFKGSKATYEDLPAEGNKVGDVWNVVAAHDTTPAGTNYAWTGTEWDALGGNIDLSNYQEKLTAGNGINITNNVISVIGGGGSVVDTVKTVNGVGPDETGNISLSADNISDLNIGDDGRTITIGTKSVTPLTADSTIAANKIDGTVNTALEATKAYQDGNGNNIANTYAKTSDLTNALAEKQNKTDTALNTTDKTIVGAINEIKSLVIGNTLPTPITDVKTITTTLENLITDTQYANKPGTILINPAITNVGTILVGEGITDINKAFPIYTDQPVTIAFKNINDFKVAGNIAGDKFNYIISFGYINTNIVSDNLKITTTNGVYEITPEGDVESMTLKLSKIS